MNWHQTKYIRVQSRATKINHDIPRQTNINQNKTKIIRADLFDFNFEDNAWNTPLLNWRGHHQDAPSIANSVYQLSEY